MKFKIQFSRVIVDPPLERAGSGASPKGSLGIEAESYEEAIAKFEAIILPNPGERIERGEVTSEG